MGALLLVVIVAILLVVARAAFRSVDAPPPPPRPPAPPGPALARPVNAAPAKATPPKSNGAPSNAAISPVVSTLGVGVTSTKVSLGGGVELTQIQIDRFAIAPHELHPADDGPLRSGMIEQVSNDLLGLDDGPTDEDEDDAEGEESDDDVVLPRAAALVAPRGWGASAIATLALEDARYESEGGVMLELGASGRAPMDVDVARAIFVHLFEMDAVLDVEQVRARYDALLGKRISLHLRDPNDAHLDALVPASRSEDGAHVVITTHAPLGRAGIVERVVPLLADEAVLEALAKAGAPEPQRLVPMVTGHATTLRLLLGGIERDASAYVAALDAAAGEGVERALAATLATLSPEVAAFARALAILPTTFELQTAMVVGRGGDEKKTRAHLAALFDARILAPACRDKFNRERAEVRPVLRSLLREGADDLAERGLALEMCNRLVDEEHRFGVGPSKRTPALYFFGLEWPSLDLARTIARARADEHATFAKAAEIFETGAPSLFARRPAMARAWGRLPR